MPADKDQPQRARTLPDGVVYWLGALVLALSAVGRLSRVTRRGTTRFVTQELWPATARLVVEAANQAAGLVTRAARSAPTWLATQRTRLVLWAVPVETMVRRALRAMWQSTRAATLTAARSSGARRAGQVAIRAAAVAAILTVGLLTGSGPVLSAVAHIVVGDHAREDLAPLPQTSEVVAAEGTTLGVVEQERRRLVDTEALPEHVTDVVLAAEDHRFRDHRGYDLAGLARAAMTNARAREVEQGGSTITQQLATLNFTGDETSIDRKLEELLYAVRLEDELSKDELLQRYLNQVYFGHGAYGIAAAAEEYFATRPQDLTVSQAALLAGIIQAPTTLDPRVHPDAAKRRRDAVLDLAGDEGLLRREEAAAAMAEPLEVVPAAPRPRADPVLDAVRAEVRTIEALGETPEDRLEALETDGLRVETTLDPALQAVVGATIGATFPDPSGPTAAVAAVDPSSGAIRALRSGRDAAGGFDLARQGRRQPGSTFKPLTAVAALERGLSPKQRLVGNGPVEFDHGGPEPWRVDNFDERDAGSVDLRRALRDSVNTAFAQLGVAVGTAAVVDVAERVGIDADAALGKPDQRGPSVALGGVAHGVSPLELATAYTAFANDGRVADPHLVRRIVDRHGDVLYEHDRRGRPAVDPPVAGQVRTMLEEAMTRGTGRAARIDGIAAFGKTGTSQDGADAWFVGSTTNLTTAVWVGHPDGRLPMPEATGGALAAPIWRQVTAAWAAAHSPGTWPSGGDIDASAPGLPLPKATRAD